MMARLHNSILGWFLVVAASMGQSDPCPQKFSKGSIDPAEIAPMVAASVADGLGLSPEDQELIYKIREMGPIAIPHLLLLLDHRNEDVRFRVAHILDGIDGLTNEHLVKLIRHVTKGNRHLTPAIGHVGTPVAISFLIGKLKDETITNPGLLRAFVSAGDRGIPALIKLFKIRNVDPAVLLTVVEIFEMMGDGAGCAIDSLCEIAQDDNLEIYVRRNAVEALGRIGVSTRDSISILNNLAETNPDVFEDFVVEAFMNMRSPEAVDYLVRDLPASPDLYKFRYIAEMGVDAVAAGPELVQYLNHPDWEVRTVAARTLGYIGYSNASQPLIEALGNTNCWRLVYVAAESLGLLKAKDSVSVLTRLSREHWYPPVRDIARDAIIKINDTSGFDSNNSDTHFYAYKNVKPNPHSTSNNVVVVDHYDDCFVTPEGSLTVKDLENLPYDTYASLIARNVGIRLDDGYLVGSTRGFYGGELMFIDTEGNTSLVGKINVQGIYPTPKGILVITARGMVYKVSRDDMGSWTPTKWKSLPGYVILSSLMKNGCLYIECFGGNIVLTPDGTIKMARRRQGPLTR